MWQCGVCGYIHEGDGPPDKCPKCGAPKEKFAALDEKRVELIERSRFGNSLLMELDNHLAVIMELAELGIEDDLDPACVKLYKECKDFAAFARQSLKAEIETHISKGK
ncbi:MAG TPA: rubredoxin, partial [Bacillota bacterium]|nr:rubredoxin [Bacillota bacterium]